MSDIRMEKTPGMEAIELKARMPQFLHVPVKPEAKGPVTTVPFLSVQPVLSLGQVNFIVSLFDTIPGGHC